MLECGCKASEAQRCNSRGFCRIFDTGVCGFPSPFLKQYDLRSTLRDDDMACGDSYGVAIDSELGFVESGTWGFTAVTRTQVPETGLRLNPLLPHNESLLYDSSELSI